jgi:hypothetical protein
VKVFLYVSDGNSNGKRLCRLISEQFPTDSVVAADTAEHLTLELKSPATRPDCVVLMVADSAELSRLLSIRKLLHDIGIVLVLPPAGIGLVAEAHLFRPRFLTFADDDGTDLIAVMRRIRDRIHSRRPSGAASDFGSIVPDGA